MMWPPVTCGECGATGTLPCLTISGKVARAPHAPRDGAAVHRNRELRAEGVGDLYAYATRREVRRRCDRQTSQTGLR